MSVTLARRVKAGVQGGEPLPDAYRVLANNRIHFRRGNLHMVAGRAGSMKTLWMLDMVRRLNVPTLFVSADSDETTIAGRLLAAAVQRPFNEVTDDMAATPSWASSILAQHDNIRWCFDSGPSLDDIDLEMEAFGELYGEYPHLMVVDTLKKISYYEDNEHGSLSRRLTFLHTLARSTGTAMIVVHHCTEGSRGDPCPSRADILEKQNDLPSLQLTVGIKGQDFYVAAVKNRHGPQDPSGYTTHRLHVNPELCSFWEGP